MSSYNNCLFYYVIKKFFVLPPGSLIKDTYLQSLFCLFREEGFFCSRLDFVWAKDRIFDSYVYALFHNLKNKNIKCLDEKVKEWSLSKRSIDGILKFKSYYEKELNNVRAMEIIGTVAYLNSLNWSCFSDNDFVNSFKAYKNISIYDGSFIGDFEIKLARKKILDRRNKTEEKTINKPKTENIKGKNRWELMDL